MSIEREPHGWNGRQAEGAMRERRTHKRAEAEERNAATPIERTKRYRLTPERQRAAVFAA